VKQLTLQHGVVLTLAALAASACTGSCAEAQLTQRSADVFGASTVSGIIRDAEGVPQMGALVEALLPDTSVTASAITDARGRYHLNLRPGRYRIQATAALFLPSVRDRLQVLRGGRTIVNLTMATLLAPSGWLPASRRTTSEPSDDWMWTLRSSAGRPILRFDSSGGLSSSQPDDEESSGPLAVSSSRQESRRGASGGSVTVKSSQGGFARGGSHNVLVLTRVNEDGSGAVLRTDLSGPRSPYPVAPSTELSVGMQRRMPLNGFTRAVLTYSNHPELTSGRGMTGMQGATLRSGERIEVGDLLRIDAGSVMRESNLGGNALIVEPFLRVSAHGPASMVLAYSMTRSRGTGSLDDLDRVGAPTPIAVMRNGHMRLETGSHHALSASGEIPGGGVIEVELFRDAFSNPLIGGVGSLAAADIPAEGLVVDPTTTTYRVAGRDYDSVGVRASIRQPVTKSMHVGAEFATGQSLRVSHLQSASMTDVLNTLAPAQSYAATAYADGKVLHTGTSIRASYRFQPLRTLTAVDGYRVGDEGAYLSCSIRQSLGHTRLLPQGLEAVVDVQNLLAQGYQPFFSSDGTTMYLAQTPRSLQAGLSFTF